MLHVFNQSGVKSKPIYHNLAYTHFLPLAQVACYPAHYTCSTLSYAFRWFTFLPASHWLNVFPHFTLVRRFPTLRNGLTFFPLLAQVNGTCFPAFYASVSRFPALCTTLTFSCPWLYALTSRPFKF